jgi:hypothetical protein
MEKFRASFHTANATVKVAINDGKINLTAIFDFAVDGGNLFGYSACVDGQYGSDFATL